MLQNNQINTIDKHLSNQVHTRATLCQYDKEQIERVNLALNLDAIKMQLNQRENNWIHVTGLNNTQFINALCYGLGVHSLVAEDIINTKQRVKAESYDGYLFVVLRAIKRSSKQSQIQYKQISFILMPKLLISFTSEPLMLFDSINERMKKIHSKIRALNVDYLLYAMMDTLVDDYMIMTEKKGDILDRLESKMIKDPTKTSLESIYKFRRELLYLRRHMQAFRDLVGMLYNERPQYEVADPYASESVISQALITYLQDLYDHTFRTLEAVDIYRDITREMLELYMNSMNHKMNQRINILTIFSTIFIPLTFITGIFGMNFRVIPGLNSSFGFFVTVGVMFMISIVLLVIFKLRKWF
ncbi:magnesium/cobalt transporter CorA [Thiotrichales bacterium 19X7-9]|nr:magnesium/cobalt transporter CorA [Thiotrichales bacterium 19X7-9]TNF67213.1 MAG: magnesium/cobalt transporter CorA [Gammaproteobacteria bacterium]UTW42719.1 magnesium/cobalt transporter CorA [bacterium SCSIO 12844]